MFSASFLRPSTFRLLSLAPNLHPLVEKILSRELGDVGGPVGQAEIPDSDEYLPKGDLSDLSSPKIFIDDGLSDLLGSPILGR